MKKQTESQKSGNLTLLCCSQILGKWFNFMSLSLLNYHIFGFIDFKNIIQLKIWFKVIMA